MAEHKCLPGVMAKCPYGDRPVCTYEDGSQCEKDNLAYLPPDIMEELQAYRDTGLASEEIERLKEYMKPFTIKDMDRFREIMDAEKDGRLVVLPEEKELTDEEIAEMTGYKCPICKHHHLCTMPGMQAMCGESYTHFEPRKPQEAEETLRKEGDNG